VIENSAIHFSKWAPTISSPWRRYFNPSIFQRSHRAMVKIASPFPRNYCACSDCRSIQCSRTHQLWLGSGCDTPPFIKPSTIAGLTACSGWNASVGVLPEYFRRGGSRRGPSFLEQIIENRPRHATRPDRTVGLLLQIVAGSGSRWPGDFRCDLECRRDCRRGRGPLEAQSLAFQHLNPCFR
jgi:hypothetical protein